MGRICMTLPTTLLTMAAASSQTVYVVDITVDDTATVSVVNKLEKTPSLLRVVAEVCAVKGWPAEVHGANSSGCSHVNR